MTTRGTLYIGTCSWKYPEWDFYPNNVEKRSFNFLSPYAARYNSVEIDQWFWSLYGAKVRMPARKDVESYAASVPEDFRFTIKAPNAITLSHHYASGAQARQYPEFANKENRHFLDPALVDDFLTTLEPMRGKLGVVMFEFAYFNKQKMSGVDEFIDRLEPFAAALPRDVQFGIEIRNPNYLTPEFHALLQRHNLAFVLLHGYFMPPAWDVAKQGALDSYPVLVLRLHGPDRSGIEELTGNVWNRIAIDRREELDRIAAIISNLTAAGATVYANINNHFEGCAPETIRRLNEILGVS